MGYKRSFSATDGNRLTVNTDAFLTIAHFWLPGSSTPFAISPSSTFSTLSAGGLYWNNAIGAASSYCMICPGTRHITNFSIIMDDLPTSAKI